MLLVLRIANAQHPSGTLKRLEGFEQRALWLFRRSLIRNSSWATELPNADLYPSRSRLNAGEEAEEEPSPRSTAR